MDKKEVESRSLVEPRSKGESRSLVELGPPERRRNVPKELRSKDAKVIREYSISNQQQIEYLKRLPISKEDRQKIINRVLNKNQ